MSKTNAQYYLEKRKTHLHSGLVVRTYLDNKDDYKHTSQDQERV